MFVLVVVWTSFLTKLIKDFNVVFLLGFGIHELGQKLSPLESIRISTGFRYFYDKLTTVSFWSLLISLCLENLRFRLVVSQK